MHTHTQEFVSGKRIALVGASRTNDKYKFGNMAAAELKRRGYEVYLVHPQAETINDIATYQNLSALKGRVEGILVSLPADKSASVLREAAAAGMTNVWIQQDGESQELIEMGDELELNLVTGKCIFMHSRCAVSIQSTASLHAWVANYKSLISRRYTHE
jgi:predicted CoA-binding protein